MTLVYHRVGVTGVGASSRVDVSQVLSNDSMVLVVPVEWHWKAAQRVTVGQGALLQPGSFKIFNVVDALSVDVH